MTTRNTDVNLIVRARTEGEKAIAGLADALDNLLGEARVGTTDLADLARTLGALDKAAATISGSMEKAGSAVDRQRATIQENNAAYAALLQQQAEAKRVLSSLDNFVGPRTEDSAKDVAKTYAAVRAEADRLEGAIGKLFATIDTQNSQLERTQSSLLKLSSSSEAIKQGQAEAEAQIELTNRALSEQAAAAERVTEVQRRINEITGVNRPDATGSAARAADILAAADAEFRRAEAARADADAQRLVNNQLAERANLESAIERTTGLGRVSAVDSGATISALTELVNKEHEAAVASEAMDREVQQLRAALDPMAAIQERYNSALARYKLLADAGKISARELAMAEEQLAADANRARAALEGGRSGSVGLFGLRPYELQNLSYQINDVVTGLASGQHVTQVIAQQGGQILQLFPRAVSSVVGALKNPAVLGAGVAIGALAAGLKEAADQASRLRDFTSLTTFRADTAHYDPASLADQAEKLERVGASAKDADAAVNAFLDKSIAIDAMEGLGRAAQETAERLGQSLPEAAKEAASAFSAGFDAVAQFDDKLNFLTASEREHIRALFDSGNAEAARTEARLAYIRMEDEAAEKQRGPWSEAARSLGNAWKALLQWIGDSLPIRATIAILNELAGAVKDVGDAITGALGHNTPDATSAAANIAKVQTQIRELKKDIADYEATISSGKSPIAGTLQHLVDQSRRQLADAEAELARLEKSAPDTLSNDPNGTQAKHRTERLAELTLEEQLQALRDAGQKGLSAADSQRRASLAGQLAYEQEIKNTGDAIIAGRVREMAVAKEAAKIDKENDTARKAAAAEREREIQQFERRVVGAEGGTAKNPYSSAKGYGQFTEGTFVDVYRRTPGADQTLGTQQILALRENERIAKGVIDQYARENAKFLESFGAKVSAGNLYLAHFLGPAGAKAVLQAGDNVPVDQILRRQNPRTADQVLNGNRQYLRTDSGAGRYRTAGELRAFIANRVGDTGSAQAGLAEEQARIQQSNIDRQNALNQAIRHGNEDREDAIKALEKENGLYGTALLVVQRQKAIEDAERELRQKAEDANKNLKPGESAVVVTPEQIARARELAAAYFDVAHAKEALKAQVDELQRPLDDLTAQRDLLREQAEYLRSIGDESAARKKEDEIRALGDGIQDAYDKLIAFYQALRGDDHATERAELGILDESQLDIIIDKLELAKKKSQEWGKVLGVSAQSIAQAFSSNLASAFTNFINKIAAGENVFKSLGNAVLEFASTFISAIAQMIIQMLAYAAAIAILRALGVPVPSSGGGGSVGTDGWNGVYHSGGIVGSPGGAKRNVVAEMFANAVRYHTGGIAGFAPDEVGAVLRRNEEVLTTDDPRHRFNGGLSGGGDDRLNFKFVNVSNPADMLTEGLATREGEKVLFNFISKNKRAFKAALDS